MARSVEHLKNMPTPNSRICFAPEAPLLATGSIPGSGCTRLRILRTCPGLDRRELIHEPVTEFGYPPAAFCRLCWAKSPMCPAGLIAGGLESGEVAVWDPREALSDMLCLHPEEESLVDKLQEGIWSRELELDLGYDFCEIEKRQESRASPPLLQAKTGNLAAAVSLAVDLLEPVALFSKHLGSVRGLEYCSHWPNLIGSGAENGRIMVWDLANPYAETVPTWETESTDGGAISCISWSPLMPRVIGLTSFQGVSIWDIRSSKSPVNIVGLFPRKLSGLVFSPMDQKSVVVSCEDYLDTPSLAVWDLRRMSKPVSELCENSKGIIAMSWSPHCDDELLVSTRNDKLMLFNMEKKEAIWKDESDSGRYYDVQWSPSNRGVFAAASHNNLDLFKLHDRVLSPV
ncbi:hypothetical protein ACQ4PT_061764 [Festuca glaucescens]